MPSHVSSIILPAAGVCRLESPDALFCPDHYIRVPVPGPLHLLSCMRLPMETAYPMTDDGVVADAGHAFQRNVLEYSDGTRFTAEVSANPALGLPTVYDLDYFFGVVSMADRLGMEPDGSLPAGYSYRQVVQITRNIPASRVNGEKVNACKRAFARLGTTTLRTMLEMGYDDRAEGVRTGNGRPAVPGARPGRRERESTHWILEYDWQREWIGGQESDVIETLKVNPIWRSQTDAGFTAWIDIDVHNSLRSGVAKAVYLRLVLATAQGWRPTLPHVQLLSAWHDTLGSKNPGKPANAASRFARALDSLKQAGVVEQFEVEPVRHGVYEVRIETGDVLRQAAAMRGIGSLDPVRTRVLLTHLGYAGIPAEEGRSLLASYGMRVQDVLQWVHYLRTVKQGKDARGRPIADWRGWVAKALDQGWTFDEPEYLAWLKRQGSRFARGAAVEPKRPRAVLAAPAAPAGTETTTAPPPSPLPPSPPAEPPLPDDIWGRALARLRAEIPSAAFSSWFRDSWLVEVADDRVRVGSPNEFGASWIQNQYGARLGELLGEELGREVRVEVRFHPPGG
jgi:hypothetical protein